MTSWRKLLTPKIEKMLNDESSHSISSLSSSGNQLWNNQVHSNGHISSKAYSPHGASSKLQSPNCESKIKVLRSQMGRLKGEILKYSKSSTSFDSPQKDLTSCSQLQNHSKLTKHSGTQRSQTILYSKTDIDSEMKSKTISENHNTKKIGKIHTFNHDNTTVPRKKRAATNLRTNLRSSRSNLDEFASIVEDRAILTDSTADIYYQEGSSQFDESSQSRSVTNVTNHDLDSNADLRTYVMQLNSELQAEKKKRRQIVKDIDLSTQEKQSLKDDLGECRREIHELKQIILCSRKDLDDLTTQLETERRNSSMLNKQLDSYEKLNQIKHKNKNKVSGSLRDENVLSFHETVVEKNDIDFNNSKRKKKKPDLHHLFSPSEKKIKSQPNTHRSSNRNGFSSPVIGEFTTRLYQKTEQLNYHSSGLRDFGGRLYQSQSTQCDIQLENLGDNDEEAHVMIENSKETILNKDYQIRKLNEEKDSLISAFQEIIQVLSAKDQPFSKAVSSVEQIGLFAQSFNKKLEEMSRYKNQVIGPYHHKGSNQRDLTFMQKEKSFHDQSSLQMSSPRSSKSSAHFRAMATRSVSSSKKIKTLVESQRDCHSFYDNFRETGDGGQDYYGEYT